MTPLQTAARAVVDRWYGPIPMPTATLIAELHQALADEMAQAVEPVLWVRKDQLNQMASGFLLSAYRSTEGRTDLTPVFTHPAPPAQQVAVPASDFDMRGVLASNLLCWHRLTEAEAQDLICFFEKVRAQQVAVLTDIEQYRVQMAGISTAALGYWSEVDEIHPDYDTPALRDVARLYKKYDQLFKEKEARRVQQVAVPVPLSDEQIQKVWDIASGSIPGWCRHIAYARAVEAHHGIGEKP